MTNLSLEDALLTLTDEEAEYALHLDGELFWTWYDRRED